SGFPRAILLLWVGCIRVTHPYVTLGQILLPDLPFDLHVLGLPLAFILSQDQTLHCNNPSAPYGTRSTYSPPHFRVIERQSNVCLSLTRIRIPFKELQKRIATSLVHKTYPLSSNVLRVRYQLSIIQRTSCP